MIRIIPICLLVVLAFPYGFNIQITSTCTNTSATSPSFCTGWSQTGTIIEDTVACFPAQTELMTKNGYVRMDQLKIRDEVLAYDPSTGQDEYSPVEGWLHYIPNKKTKFLRLMSQNLEMLVSNKHSIAFDKKYQFVFAQDMIGKRLFSDLSEETVQRIQEEEAVGVFAPMTGLSNYYVRAGNHKILAHAYAHIYRPDLVEKIFRPVSLLYSSLMGTFQPTGDYMHPLASFLKDYVASIMEY